MTGQLRRALTLISALALLPAGVYAHQTAAITGRVLERGTGRPIPDAIVLVVGTTITTRTSETGTYRINAAPAGTVQLRATRIGFGAGSQSVSTAGGTPAVADFSLAVVATQLDAVVTSAVTGKVERQRELGANVGNINVAEIQKGPITKLSEVLTGRTAGVTVQGVSGSVGTSQRIRIRGANSLSLSNEPLVYVDGNLVSNSTELSVGVGGQAASRLNDIAPEDIENIEVLKGPAATALYGTAAANGVLLITTRRGVAGATRWVAYGETGKINDVNTYPNNYYAYTATTPNAPLLTSTGAFNSAARPSCYNYVRATISTTGQPGCVLDSVAVLNTLRDARTTPYTQGNLSKLGVNVSGGSDQARYYLGVDDQNERGVIDFNSLNRLGLRANLNANLLKNLDFALSSQYTRSRLALVSNDNSIFSPLINGLSGSAFYFPSADSTGAVNPKNYRQFTPSNLADYIAHQNIDRFTIGGIGNYHPTGWLTANFNLGLDYVNNFDYRTLQPNRLPIAATFTAGNRFSQRGNNYLYTGTGNLTASYGLGEALHGSSTVGTTYNRNRLEATNGFGVGIVSGTSNLGASTSQFAVGEPFSDVISLGSYVRQELSYRDRIFLTASLRQDRNSAFGARFGNIRYPGLNASWVVNEEPWFPKASFISSLRLRTAYGRAGQRPGFRQSITFFSPVAVQVGGVEQVAVTLANTGLATLRPERTDEYEYGADMGFFASRLSLQLTHFDRTSKDALVNAPLAPSLGLTTNVFRNLGSVNNRGTEAQLDLRVFETGSTALNVRATATQLTNRIIDLGVDVSGKPISPIVFNRGAQQDTTGFSIGSFFQRPIIINDADNNGILSRSEVTLGDKPVYLGDALPRWNRSISGDLKLFSVFRVSTLFEGRGGNRQLNFTEAFRCTQGINFGDRGCSAVDNPNASLAAQAAFIANRFGGGSPSLPGTSVAGFIENGGFVKWRELALTFQLPDNTSLLRYARATGASITFSGRNLHTWTKYSGLDPEIVEAATTGFNQSEFNTQPPARFYTLRLNLNF
ncbi:MAG: SusC/RagA family TonB-linked outer membrane protein [Gemmatimonadaceae bacterium]